MARATISRVGAADVGEHEGVAVGVARRARTIRSPHGNSVIAVTSPIGTQALMPLARSARSLASVLRSTARRRAASRRRNFCTFVADIGHSVTTRTYRGTLKLDIAPRQNAMISSSVTDAPGRSSKNAAATSTYFASGTPTTCAIDTAGCVAR